MGADHAVRLHMSESSWGPSPSAILAAKLSSYELCRYPDPRRTVLTEAIAGFWGVDVDQVVVAHGSDELILLTSFALGDRTKPGLVTEATFPGYAVCLRAVGRGCVSVNRRQDRPNPTAFAAELRHTGIGYLCDPHNPTGSSMTTDEWANVLAAAVSSEVPLVIDEAYRDFETSRSIAHDFHPGGPPVIVLRTFSKAYGLASQRIGYAVGRADLIGRIRAAQATVPFSVSAAGMAAALAALADQDYLTTVVAEVAARREWFMAELAARGRRSIPSVTNFLAIPTRDALRVERDLAALGVLVRATDHFGLPDHLRVSVGSKVDLTRFLDAADQVGASGC
jgi:histidinol-phosphate aminotransferase